MYLSVEDNINVLLFILFVFIFKICFSYPQGVRNKWNKLKLKLELNAPNWTNFKFLISLLCKKCSHLKKSHVINALWPKCTENWYKKKQVCPILVHLTYLGPNMTSLSMISLGNIPHFLVTEMCRPRRWTCLTEWPPWVTPLEWPLAEKFRIYGHLAPGCTHDLTCRKDRVK